MAGEKRSDAAIEIEAMLRTAKAHSRAACCIYKVPDRLRNLNEDAYTPKVVSIGPLHYGSPSLRNKESEKQIFLNKFIERSGKTLDKLVRFVEKIEPFVRSCYSEDIKLSPKELVKIILVDAGFILELFIWSEKRDWNATDILSLNSWLLEVVRRDLLLLENQLPFFFLDELFSLAMLDKILVVSTDPPRSEPEYTDHSLFELTFKMFSVFNRRRIPQESVAKSVALKPIHFTDLLRTFYLQPEYDRRPHTPTTKEVLLYSMLELQEAGVRLTANQRRWAFSVPQNVLEIPSLLAEDEHETELLFGNMIGLEQCHYPFDLHITGYVCLLSSLIKTDEDADIVAQCGIIHVNHLDRSNLTRLFYSLAKNAPQRGFSDGYNELCLELNEFRREARIVATLRRDFYLDLKRTYCKTPLQTLATLGGILLLVLTAIQTACSIKQVV